uniref:G_PROTEIN_RECEP_F1_2 domain-containing protein n=1 Tax=Caenorhabditis tropicalis TaxID=1561998 RepID=A0A1I7TQD0_9PELO
MTSTEATTMSEEMMREWIQSQLGGGGTGGLKKTVDPSEDMEWATVGGRFGMAYIAFGILAILVNIVIFVCIIVRRRTTSSHVFYIIILNFTIIDTIKGVCSVLFALKLLTFNMATDGSMWTVRVDQYSGVLLRFTNLTTILNVLLITMNEFIFICHPLRYSSIVTRCRVLWAIVLSWLLAFLLTVLNMLTSTRQRSVMIDTDCENGILENESLISAPFCIKHQETSLFHYFVFHMILIAFCLICLAITASCYFILFRIITKLVKADVKYQAETDLLKEDHSHGKSIARRKKYVLMIGSVILVYTVYLTTYAVIQGMHLVNITSRSKGVPVHARSGYIYTKYTCYLFISFHSLLQPLCFMRMREFRNILKRTLFPCFTKTDPILTTEVFKRHSQPTDI